MMPALTGTTYYADNVNGSNFNNGLSMGTAYKTPYKAMFNADCIEVICASGWYDRDQLPIINKSVKIRAATGASVYFYGGQSTDSQTPLAWTLHDTGTYKCTRSVTLRVWDLTDLDTAGHYRRLSKKTVVADVISTPGSWMLDGTTVYVHLTDGRVPDANVKVSVASPAPLAISGAYSVYAENINFLLFDRVIMRHSKRH